jgi:peptidoglycan/LPS O-acetylase OafA/YrhL
MNTNNCFDFLRFFFAVNVLLSHLAELSNNKNLAFFIKIANAGIGIKGFFVVSGFLVAKSYTNTNSIKQYFIKRAKRILPAYVFVILFATLILSLTSTYSLYDYFSSSETYKYVGWNLIFMNFIHPCLPGVFHNTIFCAVNGALWTLKVEEGFYFVLPIIFYIITKVRKPLFILICIYIVSILYWHVMSNIFNKPLFAKQLPGYLCYFSVGIGIYLNYNFLIDKKNKFIITGVLLLLISYLFEIPLNFLYPLGFGILVIVCAYSFPFLNNFGKYGDFTYGLYIYHYPTIQLFKQYNLFEKNNPYIMSLVVILITFSFALFSWFVIEKRFLDRYKNSAIRNAH